MTGSRVIVVGDVHGCLEELDELVGELAPGPGDRLVFLGDLLDRGPDPIGVLRRVRALGAECLLGNHEEKHLRYARHEAKVRAIAGYANPMRPFTGELLAQHRALTQDDLAWMERLPVVLRLAPGWLAVHGGLEPGRPLDRQKTPLVLRLRHVNASGRFVGGDDPTVAPPGSRPWASAWRGPDSVVYGHQVHDLKVPRRDRDRGSGAECWGIDTGCCFGGHLTALVLPERRVVQVQARRAYQPLAQEASEGSGE